MQEIKGNELRSLTRVYSVLIDVAGPDRCGVSGPVAAMTLRINLSPARDADEINGTALSRLLDPWVGSLVLWDAIRGWRKLVARCSLS